MQKGLLRLALILGAGVLVVAGSGAALAHEGEPEHPSGDDSVKSTVQKQEDKRKSSSDSNSDKQKSLTEAKQTHLAEGKLRSCQAREKNINRLMDKTTARGEAHIANLTKISERVQKFYVDKGNVLSNYDALVADMNAKKVAAVAAVAKVKADRASFKCDGTDPKGVASVFKEDVKAQTTAIKGYKTSVKNLIVGVKSVQNSNDDGGSQ